MLTVSNQFGRAIVVLAALSTVLSFVEPACADVSVPAPLVGAGLPGLAGPGRRLWCNLADA